jgi:hypothetical protein
LILPPLFSSVAGESGKLYYNDQDCSNPIIVSLILGKWSDLPTFGNASVSNSTTGSGNGTTTGSGNGTTTGSGNGTTTGSGNGTTAPAASTFSSVVAANFALMYETYPLSTSASPPFDVAAQSQSFTYEPPPPSVCTSVALTPAPTPAPTQHVATKSHAVTSPRRQSAAPAGAAAVAGLAAWLAAALG